MFNKFNYNNFQKLKIIYFRDGLKGILNVIFFFLGFKFRLVSDDQKKISFFSKYISFKSNNIILDGPFKGTKLSYNINKESIASKVLGLYEKEIVIEILNSQNKRRRKYFIQLGSSDGFYVCSLLKLNIFDQSVIFERDSLSLNYLKKNLTENHILEERVKFFGEAKKNFIDQITEIGIKLEECFFLIDIEGLEYDILHEESFNKLNNTPLIVEMHEFYRKHDQKKYFNNFVEKNKNKFNKIFISNRNLPDLGFLKDILSSEIDKNLLISELRPYGMYWYTYNI
jgi:hypothetical protein